MTKFSEYLQDKSDSRNLERSQKEVERLRKLSKQTAESVEASYIAEIKASGSNALWDKFYKDNY